VVLRRLAIFAGGFTLQAASTIAAIGEIAGSDIIDCAANLVAKSLVAADLGGATGWYRLLETTRAYAFEKLSQSGEFEQLARRHAEYCRDLFERAEIELQTRPAAEWLAAYSRRIDNLRAALDWAFSPGGDSSIGVALTAAAVPLWVHLSLMEECRSRVEQALSVLVSGACRDPRCEMKLHAALGASDVHTGGVTVPEIAAWTRALEIAESIEDVEYQLRSLFGLWFFHTASRRHRAALALAQRFCILAANCPDPNDRLIGERLIGVSQYYLGDHSSARRRLEHMLAHYVPPAYKSHIIRFQSDQRVTPRVVLARILWLQGLPDQAMRTAESSIADARAANHTNSLCYALSQAACPIALLVGDLAAAEHYVRMLLDHSTRRALALWQAWGRSYQGVLVIKRGDSATGLRLLRAGLNELREAKFAALQLVTFLMAEALARAGQIVDGLAMIEEAIARSEHTEERWLIAELLRVKGELFLLQGAPEAATAAEGHFREALGWARRQGALSWELRAATSLGRLLRDQNRSIEAIALLEPIYNRFTEGFDTADLKAATALIDGFHNSQGIRDGAASTSMVAA
jgi:predicted ATPase